MRSGIAVLAAGLVAAQACKAGPQAADSATASITAHEHARLQAGGNGHTDSTGASQREAVHLTAAQAQAIGVQIALVQRGALTRAVRTFGQVVPAEPGMAEITTKIDGFVEALFVATTGTAVRRGEPLLQLYSPMLVAAQEELLAAKRLARAVDSTDAEAWRNALRLIEASRRRLAYWDISTAQIERLERSGEVTKTLTLHAPFDGVVLEKMVMAGQSVMAGMTLYRIADLSIVWIEGAVFEQDLAFVRTGMPVRAELAAYAGQAFQGRVSFVWPTVDAESRTARVRVAFANPAGLLRPGMYATLFLEAEVGRDVLSVPADAVVITGERNLVFVVGSDGRFAPREVAVGPRAGDRYQILEGLAEGDRIVASANFLVDAESRLGSGARMVDMPGMTGAPERRP